MKSACAICSEKGHSLALPAVERRCERCGRLLCFFHRCTDSVRPCYTPHVPRLPRNVERRLAALRFGAPCFQDGVVDDLRATLSCFM